MSQSRYPDSKNSNSIQEGLEFQDFVMETLLKQHGIVVQVFSSKKYQFDKGESIQGCEIKLDNPCTRTGRLSIETEEKTAEGRDWVPGGIYAGNSIFYIHGNFECFWIFQTHFLQQLECCKKSNGKHKYEHKEEPTVRAFYLPIEHANKYGVRVVPDGIG